jgi:hypothetical protein
LAQATKIRRCVHIGEATQKGDAPPAKVGKRVAKRVWRGPADIRERAGWAARAETHEPVSAVSRGTKHSVRTTQNAKCSPDVGGARVGYVAADNHCPATFYLVKGPVHADSEIATALVDTLSCHWQRKARPVGGNGKNSPEASLSGQRSKQHNHCVPMEIECGACTDPVCKPPLHPAKTWCTAKYEYRIAHDPAQDAARDQ